jgi:hypothetical protein
LRFETSRRVVKVISCWERLTPHLYMFR